MLEALRVEAKGLIHIHKGVLNALCLTCWNFATSNYKSKTKQRGRPKGCIIYVLIVAMYSKCVVQEGKLYIHFCVGLSPLLVSTYRAMRRPQHVERAADRLHA